VGSGQMGIEHLQGRRSGRPRGVKSAPPWVRAARWALENLDTPDAVPPSALAARLLALGREHPDRLAVCLASLEAIGHKAGEQDCCPQHPSLNGASAKGSGIADNGQQGDSETPELLVRGTPSRRLRKVCVETQQLIYRLTGDGTAWISNLPRDARPVGCETDPTRDGIILIIYSGTYPPVAAGEPIPEIEPMYSR
jgi:hypothetical protein